MNYGVCVECKARHNDSSEKELHVCSFCGREFCVKHLEPKIVHIPNLKAVIKDPILRVTLEEEAKIEGGHPDFQYSQKRFEEAKIEIELQLKLRKAAFDRMMAYYKGMPYYRGKLEKELVKEIKRIPPQRKPGSVGVCPKCVSSNSDMVDYDAKTMTFVCKKCGHKWTQLKAFPHDIIKSKEEEPEKPPEEEIISIPVRVMPAKSPRKTRRVVGFLLIGLIIGATIGSFSWHFLIELPNIQRWQQHATQLEAELAITIEEKTTLESNLRTLQSELTKIKNEKHLLEQEFSSLETELGILKIQYEDLDRTYKDLDKKYEELFEDYYWADWILTEVLDRPLEQKDVPSTSNVDRWLTSDRTDQFIYTDPDFICGDFAIILTVHARAKHWDMGIIAIWGYETETNEEFNHAFNAIITKEGLIYIEPQNDDIWWYENHQAIRKGKIYGIGTYETVDVYIEDVQIILSY